MSGVGPCARGSVAVAVEVGGDVAPRAAVLGGAVRGELGMVVRGARGPRASWRASGGGLVWPKIPTAVTRSGVEKTGGADISGWRGSC